MSNRAKTWVRGRWAHGSRWFSDDVGAVAVEFAMLSPMFIALVLVSIIVGVSFMVKSELDYTTQKVARLVMTGQVTSSSQLQTQVCNYTGGLVDCSKIMANLTSYTHAQLDSINTSTPTLTYNASGAVSNTWNAQTGSAGSIEVLQLIYQFPMIGGPLFSFSSSNGNMLMVSTAVFVNE